MDSYFYENTPSTYLKQRKENIEEELLTGEILRSKLALERLEIIKELSYRKKK